MSDVNHVGSLATAFNAAGHPTPVAADVERMGKVLGKLLDNALRHTPAGGVVTVAET